MTHRPPRSGTRRTPPVAWRATRFAVLGLSLAVVLAAGACGSDDGSADVPTFCAAVEALREGDPFAELDVATPAEMRGAFDALADGADRIADAAPADAQVQAERYVDAVDALRDELAGAGWNATRVDTRRYGAAADDYAEAAESLDNAADATC